MDSLRNALDGARGTSLGTGSIEGGVERRELTKTLMENKKTTELLDLLHSLVDKDGHFKDAEKYEEAREELLSREPFFSLWKPRNDETVSEELDQIDEDIKKLKRHKHDSGGDVLIRI